MQRRHPSKEQHMTPTELQRLKEEAARANSAYDAARKAYKAQQKAQTGATRSEPRNGSLHDLRKGIASSRVYSVPRVPCVPAVFAASESVTGEIE